MKSAVTSYLRFLGLAALVPSLLKLQTPDRNLARPHLTQIFASFATFCSKSSFFCPNNLRCLLFNSLLLSSVLGCDQSVLPEKSKITVKTTAPTSGLVYQHECLTLPWG